MSAKRFVIILSLVISLLSCESKKTANPLQESTAVLYDSTLKPFYHGVASGDPLSDRVIIWTRVTPDNAVASIPVTWEVAENENFATLITTDTTRAYEAKDYTVKVDVTGLQPGKTYFYRFHALGKTSMVGRTKTSPDIALDSLKFAVVSCANWEWGFFTPYDKIADRDDVFAVIHLGDYLYEYGPGKYGDTTLGRKHLPPHEIVSLSDYRTRHAQYRLDKGLRSVSQQHPLIAIWDDHEVANDSYTKGAQNHQPDEGDYEKRKTAARQAYYEWIPIREDGKLYRSFSFGNLADLIMLDERLEGRTKPVDSLSDPTYFSEERSMLGAEQLNWMEEKLKNSSAAWKVVGNQVMISEIIFSPEYRRVARNLDSWDGWPAEKNRLVNYIQGNGIKDIIFITGDTHAAWAIEAATNIEKTYNPKTSVGAFAIELGTTSVSSGNDDERMPVEKVKEIEAAAKKINPHVKYVNDRDHGYLLLTLYPDKAKGEYYIVETLKKPEATETVDKQVEIVKGSTIIKLK